MYGLIISLQLVENGHIQEEMAGQIFPRWSIWDLLVSSLACRGLGMCAWTPEVVTGIFVDSAVTTRTEDEVVDAFKVSWDVFLFGHA